MIRKIRHKLIEWLAGSDMIAINVTVKNGGFYVPSGTSGMFKNCNVYSDRIGIQFGGKRL